MDREPTRAIDDIDLAASIAAELQFDTRVPVGVTLAVTRSIVTLEGEVDCPAQREAAESIVRRFPSVQAVRNRLIIKQSYTA